MITCPNCQRKNPEGTKFCENCGTKLSLACPNCGNSINIGAKFCGNCGYKLEAESDPQLERLKKLVPKELADRLLGSRQGKIERERRIVTILFCDVKGSTSLGEERDPEEILEIMNGAFEVLIEPIYRFEGTLARLMGDAILAFFGAPISHEDDPVRAVLAALEIQSRMPAYAAKLTKKYGIKNFTVRVGINTGLVVVGEVGSDLRVEYTAMGDAINVASRLENAALPGTIVISGNTARSVRHVFKLESLGGLELKGKAEPVPAYRVSGKKEAPESARGIEGLYSPLVGRDREMSILRACLNNLVLGRGQIVSIIGEAGLGKSRLLAELRKDGRNAKIEDGDTETGREGGREGDRETGRQAEEGRAEPSVKWLEGRALSYQVSTPYTPFVDLFGRLFELHGEEHDLDKYEKVKAGIGRILPERIPELAPFFAVLLGIELVGEDLDRIKYLLPPDLRGRIFRAVEQLLEEMAAKQALALLFEDLHWADPTSIDLVQQLMGLADRAGVGIVALFRPQRQDPSWQFHEAASREYHHRYTEIQLAPLRETDARTLVANLLQIEDLPEQVRLLVLKKAEGNPFYVEEVIRSLLDAQVVIREGGHWRATREITNIQVPDTLAAVITARLDRLDDEPKRTAQTAAVIGREFQFDVLSEVYETPEQLTPSLRNLEKKEIVKERSRVPQRLYLFKHVVTQETAYASMSLKKRREIHRRVAECLERTDPTRVNEIAWHFTEAKEDQRSLPYLIAAGDLAARAYSMPEAIGYYVRAVEIAKAGDNNGLARRAFEGLGRANSFTFNVPAAVKTFEEMDDWAKVHNDAPMQVSAINKLAYVLAFNAGQFPSAEKYLGEAEQLAKQAQDKPGLVEAAFVRCGMCTAVGDFDSVVFYMTQSADFGRELNIQDQVAAALDHTARAHMLMTRFEDADKSAQEALQYARDIKNREIESAVLTTVAGLELRKGNMDAARGAAEEGKAIAERIGAMVGGIAAPWAVGTLLRLQGDYEGAIANLQLAVQHGYPLESFQGFMLAWPLASLGSTYAEIGMAYGPRAAEMHSHTLELLAGPSGAPAAGTAFADIGFTALEQGRLDDAETSFQKALTVPSMYRYLFQPQSQLGVALVALQRSQIERAAQLIGGAREYVEKREMVNLYPLVSFAAAHLYAARGEREKALEEFTRAESFASRMNMRPILWQTRLEAAKLLALMGRTEESEARSKSARVVVQQIADLFADQEMRSVFIESADRRLK